MNPFPWSWPVSLYFSVHFEKNGKFKDAIDIFNAYNHIILELFEFFKVIKTEVWP